ncbi:MAG: cytochrome b/b6 domain-containing protein [Alphaproteobacteria bacterium]|nr:cytochrome b/b6 domain-containing protein [Alphaproteobacteria bacterium]
MSERIYLLPVWIRAWHWCNAVLILTLIVTGASLHFSDPNLPLLEFSRAASIHNVAGVALASLYGLFVVANIVSGNWWQYVPKPPGIGHRCMVQARYYAYGIFRGESHPYPPTREANFNALQALVYWFVMYILVPTVVATGLVFMNPEIAPERLFGLDGLLPVAVLHYLSGTIITLFVVAHIYLGTTGVTVTSLFKMMITGWHEH